MNEVIHSVGQTSKLVDILLTNAFGQNNEIKSGKLCLLIQRMLHIVDEDFKTEGNPTRIALETLAKKHEEVLISRKQILKVARMLSRREWITKISAFHIIASMAIILHEDGEEINNYVKSEMMFRPAIENFAQQESVEYEALTQHLYHDTALVDELAASVCLYDNVIIEGNLGTGRKSLVLSFVKAVILGEYPLIYNSVFLCNPEKNQIAATCEEESGTYVISIVSDAFSKQDLAPSNNDLSTFSGILRRSKAIFIVPSSSHSAIMDAVRHKAIDAHIIKMPTPSRDKVLNIIKTKLFHIKEFMDLTVEDQALEIIVDSSDRLMATSSQPSRAIFLTYEVMINKMNSVILENGSKINIPLSLMSIDKDNVNSILKRVTETTAFRMMKHAAMHIHISVKDVETFIMSKFQITQEMFSVVVASGSLTSISNIEHKLKQYVFGQEQAVLELSKSMKRRALRLDDMRKPASYMFVGPTGVGKTYLAKRLAHITLGSEQKMIRLDMSEYMHSHEISKLMGSPPGYVGSTSPGRLTVELENNPFCVLLLDEIEKAHPDILNLFLQILDDGRVTDNHSKVLDFSKCTIIMTSNTGAREADEIANTSKIGYGDRIGELASDSKEVMMKEIEKYFRPEFLNRISKIIIFDKLKDPEFLSIIKARLDEIMKSSSVTITMNIDKIATHILEITRDKKNGYKLDKYSAREIHRAIIDIVENKIVDVFGTEESKETQEIEVLLTTANEIKIKPKKA